MALSLDFRSIVTVAAEPQAPPPVTSTSPMCAALREKQQEEKEEDEKKEGDKTVTPHTLSPLSLTPPPSPAAIRVCAAEAELERQSVEQKSEEREVERKMDVIEQPRKKPSWLEDDDLPPMM